MQALKGRCRLTDVVTESPVHFQEREFRVDGDTTLEVRGVWVQSAVVEFETPVSALALMGRILWRMGGEWQPLRPALPRRVSRIEYRMLPGSEPGELELRAGEHRFRFPYPGRPVEQPTFVVPAR